ncbi:MAG: hypothetical protein ABSA34_00705 [Candidatus Goldiibacteriota bacterium]|jgi:hypothetical protein
MKKFLFILVLLSAFFSASAIFADAHLGISAGYSYATMDDMKAGLDQMKEAALNLTPTSHVNMGDFGNSVYANIDLDVGVNDFLSVGPRFGGQYVLPVNITITDPSDPSITTSNAYSALLIPVEIGVKTKLRLPVVPVLLTAGIYGGYGLAFVTQGVNIAVNPGYSIPGFNAAVYNNLYQGGGLMADGVGTAELMLGDNFTISINLGYRKAAFNNLKSVDRVVIAGQTIIAPGQLVEDGTGQQRTADFSGFNGGLGINLRF